MSKATNLDTVSPFTDSDTQLGARLVAERRIRFKPGANGKGTRKRLSLSACPPRLSNSVSAAYHCRVQYQGSNNGVGIRQSQKGIGQFLASSLSLYRNSGYGGPSSLIKSQCGDLH